MLWPIHHSPLSFVSFLAICILFRVKTSPYVLATLSLYSSHATFPSIFTSFNLHFLHLLYQIKPLPQSAVKPQSPICQTVTRIHTLERGSTTDKPVAQHYQNLRSTSLFSHLQMYKFWKPQRRSPNKRGVRRSYQSSIYILSCASSYALSRSKGQ